MSGQLVHSALDSSLTLTFALSVVDLLHWSILSVLSVLVLALFVLSMQRMHAEKPRVAHGQRPRVHLSDAETALILQRAQLTLGIAREHICCADCEFVQTNSRTPPSLQT